MSSKLSNMREKRIWCKNRRVGDDTATGGPVRQDGLICRRHGTAGGGPVRHCKDSLIAAGQSKDDDIAAQVRKEEVR